MKFAIITLLVTLATSIPAPDAGAGAPGHVHNHPTEPVPKNVVSNSIPQVPQVSQVPQIVAPLGEDTTNKPKNPKKKTCKKRVIPEKVSKDEAPLSSSSAQSPNSPAYNPQDANPTVSSPEASSEAPEAPIEPVVPEASSVPVVVPVDQIVAATTSPTLVADACGDSQAITPPSAQTPAVAPGADQADSAYKSGVVPSIPQANSIISSTSASPTIEAVKNQAAAYDAKVYSSGSASMICSIASIVFVTSLMMM